jgi:ribosome-associated toxin RatA of RatAB toxin-antitoxin module
MVQVTIIQRSALVPYTQRQMFELVNSTEEYPRFLPWCSASRVVHQSETEVEAALDISWSGMHKSFTTRNHLHPYDRIEIVLVTGPFKYLAGRWTFISIGDHGCKVGLDLQVEFLTGFIDKLFQPIFNHIANSLVDAFCKRAVEIYGPQ